MLAGPSEGLKGQGVPALYETQLVNYLRSLHSCIFQNLPP
jgi:hypothetical protein